MEYPRLLCRICGERTYAEGVRMNEHVGCTSLEKMLRYCTKLNFEVHDEDENVICTKCKEDLLIAYKLIVLYHKTSANWVELKTRHEIHAVARSIDATDESRIYSTETDPIATDTTEKKNTDEILKMPKKIFRQESQLVTKVIRKDPLGRYHPKGGPVPTSCSTCGENFVNIGALRKHHSLACGMDDCISKRWADSRPKCCGCNTEFDSREHLRAHSKSIHRAEFEATEHPPVAGQNRFVCNICYRCYTSRSILLEHKQRPYRTKLYQCAICGKSFRDKYSLEDHERVHSDERPFVCEICSKTFAMKESYRKHLRLHTFPLDRLKCDVCGKGFRTNGNLKEHLVTHTLAKSLECPRCPSKFSRKSCLKSHMRLHTGEKPYKCEICEAMYTFPSDLRRHRMAHDGVKPFTCGVCDKAYPRKDYLAKHVASSHPHKVEPKSSIDEVIKPYTQRSET